MESPPPVAVPGPAVIGVNTMHANDGRLAQMVIGFLVTDGFEQDELVAPRQAMANEGATTFIVSPKSGTLQGYRGEAKADLVKSDVSIVDATTKEFEALVIPGGILSADKLRANPAVTAFTHAFVRSGAPVAAICHGLWPLVEGADLRGRALTSCASVKTDVKNAGAKWSDQGAVTDRNLVSGRDATDVQAFTASAMDLFAKTLENESKPAIGGGPVPSEE
jgi:protease I